MIYHFGAVLNGLFSVESAVLSGDTLTEDSCVFVNEYRRRRMRIRSEGARLGQRSERLAWRKNLGAASRTIASFRWQRSQKPCDLPRHGWLASSWCSRSESSLWTLTVWKARRRKWEQRKFSGASFWRISWDQKPTKEASFKGYTFLKF